MVRFNLDEYLERARADPLNRPQDDFGDTTRRWRRKRWQKQNGKCAYCQQPMCRNNATLDHVIPFGRGGLHVWNNTAAACKKCNEAKGNMTPDEFRARSTVQPEDDGR